MFTASSKRVRTALTLVSRQRLWPRCRAHSGIANGWQGAAWVAFKLAGAGGTVADRVLASVHHRLIDELAQPPQPQYAGAFIGCAADAVIAAYAMRHGLASRAVGRTACRRVVAATRTSPAWDLHLGLAGALLALAEVATVEPRALRDVQPGRLASQLLAKLDALCALPPHGWQTGLAHGPAGAILALESCAALGWCRVTRAHRQRGIDVLTRTAMADADGALYWPTIAGQLRLGLQSWCAGTPGIALALLQCFRLTREPVYLELARSALGAMQVLSRKDFRSRTLCCGSAGYRHIFLEAHRITGEPGWLAHAEQEPRLAADARARPQLGLLQGELGIAYLAERLARPLDYPLPSMGTASA